MSKNIYQTCKKNLIIFNNIFRIKNDNNVNIIFKYNKIIFIKRNYIKNILITKKITIII